MPRALLASMLDRIREDEPVHKWDPEAVTKHFAYLLPEGQRFSLADIERVMLGLELGKVHVEHILDKLTDRERGLVQQREVRDTFRSRMGLGPARLIERYHLHRKARVEYEAVVAELGWGPEPEQHAISQRLAELVPRLSDPQQQVFLDETLKCLRIDANRAAIVMGWNLAYDHLRQWVFCHHLTPFNAELTSRVEKRNKNYDAVTNYEDFPKSEWLVLDICEKAGLIAGHERDIVFDALRKRNRYAHPSSAVATPAIAAGHIEDLLEHVVLNKEFAW
ncbi:MAG: hypothetical protein ABIP48_26985 [Planctomycetota bacterium]